MKKKDLFDRIIKDAIGNPSMFGYCLLPNNDKKYHKYDMYYSNSEFNKLCKVMKEEYPSIYASYSRGKGSELIGTPPKMASVASSSRFCYLSLRNASIRDFEVTESQIKPFEFEKDLKVYDISGTNPQMDAFIETDNSYYFFEFKCHEIFDEKAKKLSIQYDINYLNKWGIFRDSNNIPTDKFGIEEIRLFDLKQFITHLIGIINYSDKEKRKVFSYVYFKPKKAGKELFDYDDLASEIKAVFKSEVVQRICKDNSIELRLYYYENDVMDGFEKEIKPKQIEL